jgi:curved DNA-binding protein CbpA
MKNPYHTLGLKVGSSEEQIIAAFRSLSKVYHPDTGGDSELFKNILDAYTFLKDTNNKEKFDRDNAVSKNSDNATHNMEPLNIDLNHNDHSFSSGKKLTISIILNFILFFGFIYIASTQEKEASVMKVGNTSQLEENTRILQDSLNNANRELSKLKEELTNIKSKDLEIAKLTASGIQFKSDGGYEVSGYVFGNIINDSESEVRNYEIVVTFYDKNDLVVGTADESISSKLEPHGSRPFKISVYPHPKNYTRIDIQAKDKTIRFKK